MLLRPKSWDKFQHYKDRCPPWIKLHRDLLTDREFMCLPLASKAIAPLMWLLASESKDGTFDGSLEELQFRLHISKKDYEDGLKPLIDKGFFVVASGVLADSLQVAIPETERETEKETKKRQKAPAAVCPPDVDEKVWQDYLVIRKAKKLPVTETALEDIRSEAALAGMTLDRAIRECVIRGWAGFKSKWLVEKMTSAEQRMNTMHQLTGGLTTPKVANFWDKPKLDVIEVQDVERKRLL